jgi:NadR type nicotinamide-nucleotide adenylyltransferase
MMEGEAYLRRIVFTGAECTGKSTLARAIADHYNEPLSREYVRDHVNGLERDLTALDLDPIARGQLKYEDEAYRKAKKLVFHDTNLLSSILYAEHYFDTQIKWVDDRFLERNYAVYFLCMPDFPWQSDPGQRVGPKEREKLQSLFVKILKRFNISYVEVSGDLQERVEQVLAYLKLNIESR